MSLDWEQIEQEERLWPWINDPGDECADMPTGYWADYIFDPPKEDE
jgi:hypothetical protein